MLEDAIKELTEELKRHRNSFVRLWQEKGGKSAAPAAEEDDEAQAADADAENDPEADDEKPAKGKTKAIKPSKMPGRPKLEPADEEPVEDAEDDTPAEEEAEEPADDEEAEDDEVTKKRDLLRDKIKKIMAKEGREPALAILKKVGAKELSSVPAEKLDTAIKLCKAALA